MIKSYGGYFMHLDRTFAVLGGDLRQVDVANRLLARGERVHALLMEKNQLRAPALQQAGELRQVLQSCDVVILPLPLTTDEQTVNAPFSGKSLPLEECFRLLRPGAAVFAGKVSRRARELAERFQIHLNDYLEREELAVKNARVTAEGALAIALDELPIAMFQAHCLVTGHGRVAKELIRVLRGMGAPITVCARKYKDLAEIEMEGCQAAPISQLAQAARNADVIFNTVPAKLFGRACLTNLRPETLLIDLASRPGGVDLAAAGELGIHTIWALSLPGKCAPLTAGDIILQTVENCLEEEEL